MGCIHPASLFMACKWCNLCSFHVIYAWIVHRWIVNRVSWTSTTHFRALWSKFVKYLTPILRWHVNSSSIFVSFFIVKIHNSSVNFKLIHFLLWTKGSYQSSNFDTFECSKFLMSFSKQQVNFSSNFASLFNVMKDNSSVLF